MTQHPNYAAMTRADLLHATTRLALDTEAAEIAGKHCRALELRERYHLAMAELIAKSATGGSGMPPAEALLAQQRAERTRQGHLDEAALCQLQRLGLGKAVPA